MRIKITVFAFENLYLNLASEEASSKKKDCSTKLYSLQSHVALKLGRYFQTPCFSSK